MRFMKGAVLGAILSFGFCHSAFAQWPKEKPIEIVVGFAAGGGTDIMARKLFGFVEKRLGDGAKFVIVNKPGASGEIANAYVARATPDGYTLGVVNVPSYIFVPMTKKAQYAPEDFRLIARVVDDPTILVTHGTSPHKTINDVLAALRAKAGSVSFGHNGIGSNGHLALRMLIEATKLEPNEVSYRGTAQQKTDLIGNHLNIAMISAGEVPELHGDGKADIRVMAQFTKTRLSALGNAPTAIESGLNILMSSERGIAAPRSVPDAIITKIEKAIEESLRDPEFIRTSPGDAPVLAFLPGMQWKISLEENAKVLSALAEKMPK